MNITSSFNGFTPMATICPVSGESAASRMNDSRCAAQAAAIFSSILAGSFRFEFRHHVQDLLLWERSCLDVNDDGFFHFEFARDVGYARPTGFG
jgi:hypothetical protein